MTIQHLSEGQGIENQIGLLTHTIDEGLFVSTSVSLKDQSTIDRVREEERRLSDRLQKLGTQLEKVRSRMAKPKYTEKVPLNIQKKDVLQAQDLTATIANVAKSKKTLDTLLENVK